VTSVLPDPGGTTAWISFGPTWVKSAALPPKLTCDADPMPVPVMTTVLPAGPDGGVTDRMAM
jgi:hypothetical protein